MSRTDPRQALGAVAAAVTLGFAPVAPAHSAPAPAKPPSTLITALKKYCVDTEARGSAIDAAADNDGLPKAPDDVLRGAPLDHPQGRLIPNDQLLLVTGQMVAPKRIKGYALDACLVAGQPADGAAVVAELGRTVGLAPYERDSDNVPYYYFDEGPQGRRSIEGRSDEALQDLARQGRVRVATALREEHVTALIYGVMRLAVAAEADTAPAAPTANAAPVRTPFDDFKDLCVAHRGAPQDSLKAAGDAGWLVTPRHVKDDPVSELPYPVVAGDVRMRSTEEDLEIFIAGSGRMQVNLQILSFSVCAVVQAPPADHELLSQVNGWVGVEPADSYPDGSRIYLFVEDASGRHSIGGAGLSRALTRGGRNGTVSIVITQQGSASFSSAVAAYGVVTGVAQVSAAPTAYAQR